MDERAHGTPVLITGISGQDGTYLARDLAAQGRRVCGLTRSRPQPGWHAVSYENWEEIRAVLDAVRPAEIYHLASPSSLQDTRAFATDVVTLGVVVTQHLLRWIAESSPATRFFFASSAEIYGEPASTPQDEATPYSPRHPYAIAKVAGMEMVRHFREEKGVFACSGILYNHESPLRRKEFVSRRISCAVAEIAAGVRRNLSLGNLEAVRDWSHASDFAQAYRLALEAAEPADYVLASGQPHTVAEFCQEAFACVGLDWRDFVVTDQDRVRRDPPLPRVGNPARAETRLGWKRAYDFPALVREMVSADQQAPGQQ